MVDAIRYHRPDAAGDNTICGIPIYTNPPMAEDSTSMYNRCVPCETAHRAFPVAVDHRGLLLRWNDLSKREEWEIVEGDLHNMIDEAVEQIENLNAQIFEYEHALVHVAEEHDGGCPQCQKLAASALAGLNREMCLEIIREN